MHAIVHLRNGQGVIVSGEPHIFYIELRDIPASSLDRVDRLSKRLGLVHLPRYAGHEDRLSHVVAHALRLYARHRCPSPGAYDSLTHTRELAAVCVSGTGPVGIDAEPVARDIDPDIDTAALAAFFMSAQERHTFDRDDSGNATGRLLRLWTLKEALSKAVGLGAGLDFTKLSFAFHPLRLVAAPDSCGPCSHWSFFEHPLPGSHAIALACNARPGTVTPRWHALSLSELLTTVCEAA
jgi:phosphopantetheinyl transferase